MPSSRRSASQITLDVLDKTWLTPGLVRIALGGPQFDGFPATDATDAYVKLYFVPAGSTLTPPYDFDALRETHAVDELPSTRTYTIRRHDPESRRIEIDFVAHGDTGLAGPWAVAAEPGDSLTLSTPGGAFRPDIEADHLVLIGDESAFPAISSALEAVEADQAVTVVVEARDAEHRIAFPGDRAVQWVDEDHDAPGHALVAAVEALDWPEGRVQVFAHGERGSMKLLRPVLVERGVSRQDLSLSAYWAFGRTEDRFQAEKREPVGQIFED